MAVVRVTHNIGDLAADLVRIPKDARKRGRKVVRGNVRRGTLTEKRIAQGAAGPHGSNFHKRISGEMTGPLTGEFGPSALVGTRYVGVDGDAGVNRDLDKTVRVVGPAFARDVSKMVDGLFW